MIPSFVRDLASSPLVHDANYELPGSSFLSFKLHIVFATVHNSPFLLDVSAGALLAF